MRLYTFAAMATEMDHEAESRVFAAATDRETLSELKQRICRSLRTEISAGSTASCWAQPPRSGMRGGCLLGEMPHIFAQLPYPKASLAVLNAFSTITKIDIDLTELSEQAKEMDEKLGELLAQMQKAIQHGGQAEEEQEDTDEAIRREAAEQEGLDSEDRARIERLFEQAKQDRSSAYELKRELDRLAVYREYEDRFLDLFKKPQ